MPVSLRLTLSTNGMVRKTLVEVLSAATAGWSPAFVANAIQRGEVPREYAERVSALVWSEPSLVSVDKAELLAGLRLVRPDLADLVETTEGGAWLDRCVAEVALALLTTQPGRGV